jgi:hypothetical protein
MKVTKAKGLKTDLTVQLARTSERQWFDARGHGVLGAPLLFGSVYPRPMALRIEPILFVVCSHDHKPNLFSGSLLWLLSFEPTNESDRRRGATRGL